MTTTNLNSIIEPVVFTQYQIQNSLENTPLLNSRIVTLNGVMQSQLKAGAHSFTVPFWQDLADDEANIVNDDPNDRSTPYKIGTGKQVVRKSFLHNSWSAMNLASEIAGADADERIKTRVKAYWDRQLQKRLVASLVGMKAANASDNASDMITVEALFNAESVIKAAGTLGEQMGDITAIAMHSDIYQRALTNDLIETMPDSEGGFIQTFRGLAIIVSDALPVSEEGDYTSVLFGADAFGYALAAPNYSEGTEVESLPSAGKGGGQFILHSRLSLAMHPAGYTWNETTVASESPDLSELILPANWTRVLERKAVKIAFLETK